MVNAQKHEVIALFIDDLLHIGRIIGAQDVAGVVVCGQPRHLRMGGKIDDAGRLYVSVVWDEP